MREETSDRSSEVDPLCRLIVLGHVVQNGGRVPDHTLTTLEAYLAYQGVLPDAETLHRVIESAQAEYRDGPRRVFVCAGSQCREHHPTMNEKYLRRLEDAIGAPVTVTDCQNRCGAAPSLTLRDGDRCAALRPR